MVDSQCLHCRHLTVPNDRFTCPAFPDGIPDEISYNECDNRDPYQGDQGIRWEPATDYDREHWVGELCYEGEDGVLTPSRKGKW